MKRAKFKIQSSRLLLVFIVFLLFYVIYRNIASSVVLTKKDRLNIVFYSAKTVYYSLGINDVSYVIPFPADMEITVPGGYGNYRVGAIGKLVSLEKKPDIFRKAFSAATGSFVNLYFYPRQTKIYYSNQNSKATMPGWSDIFLTNTNANFIDRLLIFWQIIHIDANDHQEITDLPSVSEGQETVFDQDTFYKKYQGFFYKKTYRNLKDNVQILYTKSYQVALLLSKIIEGEGIRVVDISQSQISNLKSQNCVITYSKNALMVANDLQKFFGCEKKEGNPDVSDIIITLGNLENEWQ